MINSLEEKTKQNTVCGLSFLLQVDRVDHSPLLLPLLASMATCSSWFSPLSQSPCKGQTCILLSNPWWLPLSLLSSHLLQSPILQQCLCCCFPNLCPSLDFLTPLWQFHLDDAKMPPVTCAEWIFLFSKAAPPQPTTPSFTRLPKTGTPLSSWALPSSSRPSAKGAEACHFCLCLDTPFTSLHSHCHRPRLGHYHLFPGLLH